MKIVIVAFQYSRKNLRLLPWRYIYDFSQQFSTLGHTVTIVSDGYPELAGENQIGGIPVVRLTHIKHFPPRNFDEIVKTIAGLRPNIVFWLMGLTCFFQKKVYDALRCPIIALIGSSVYWRREFFNNLNIIDVILERNLLLTGLVETFLPRFLARNTLNSNAIKYVVTLSKQNLKRLKQIGVMPEKLVNISPNVDSSFFESSSDKEVQETRLDLIGESNRLLVVYLGPPLLTRGVDTLIKAIDYAINVDFRLKQHLHALFLLRTRENGNNLQERYVFRLFERMKNRDIITVKSGFLSKSKVKSFLASSDLVVFPFKYVVSDFPMGVVEAMSLGKPVICTRVDGMSELLEDGRGIIIEPHDFAALGRILVYFSKNKLELNEYGKRSQQYSIGKPTWRDSAQKLLKLASDLI